jgi:uncharacterized protein YndB with AHSA1/START domain
MAATLEKPSLRFKRHYAVPVEKVFRAWTDPQALKQWFGPSNDGQILVSETDLKVGGRYRIVMQMPSGEQHRVGGVYREIVPNEKLVFTWAWDAAPPDEPHESLVTVLLKPDEGGTLLTLIHEHLFDEETRTGHEGGWNGALDKLEKLVA